jgi:hypothetical protein
LLISKVNSNGLAKTKKSLARDLILQEIESIGPFDLLEKLQKDETIAWILSGAELPLVIEFRQLHFGGG